MSRKIKTAGGLVDVDFRIKTISGLIQVALHGKSGSGIVGYGGGAVEPPTGLLRMAAVNNTVNNGTMARTGKNRCYIRVPYMIGSGDRSELVLSHYGYNMTIGGLAANANPFDVTLAAISGAAGTVSVPVTYAAGRLATIAGNAHDVQMDSLLPSAFGLTEFSVGDVYWLKMQTDFATGGALPTAISFRTTSVPGTQFLWVDSAASTVVEGTGVDSPGSFSFTGTAPDSQSYGYMPILLGKFVSGDPDVWYGAGDSDLNSVGDVADSPWGMGFFTRALYDNGAPGRVLAGFNCGKPSGYITNFRTLTNLAKWQDYCNNGVEECGLNDLGATTGTALSTATFLTQCKQAWALMYTHDFRSVLRTWMLGRLQSSDSFATEAGQTFVGGTWGDAAAALNAAFQAEVGVTIDALVPMTSCRGTVDSTKWRANGTALYATADGVHKSAAAHVLAAAELRSYMDAA